MAWSYVIVVDQGTHSTRTVIYDQLGHSIYKSQQDIDLFYRDSTHIEQDGSQILHSCESVLIDAHEYIKKHQLKNIAVALTTQRSTVIAWDSNTGEAITPALSWLDTRAQEELQNLSINEHIIKQKTGLPRSPHYGASKLQWLLQNDEMVKQKKQQNQLKIGPLAAYLIFNLIEQKPCYVDFSNAHRTMLWNLQTNIWDADLLAEFDIDAENLPEPVPNRFEYGFVNNTEYPLVLVNGDQNSAVYGYGKLESNTSLINIGTGAFVLAKSKHRPILNTQLLATIIYSSKDEQEFALEGTVNGAGAAMSWAEDEWKMHEIEKIAWKNVGDVPIFLNSIGGLGSPFWRSDISPRFIHEDRNYKNYSNQQRMAALMESIAFLITINVDEMRKHKIDVDQILIAGGMSKDEHLCQCIADLCTATVIVSSFKEATSRGAAWLTMHKPDWDVLESQQIYPKENPSLLSRFDEFKIALQGIMH